MPNYSALERMLHRLALGSAMVGELQFDLECGLEKPLAEATGRHVFVAGLARAGTTILMRSIYGSNQFGTLTYRDMPFVMAPNLWARLHSRSSRDIAAGERAHGDGIVVDADSPEALEEVFWRVFLGDVYLRADDPGLKPHTVPADIIENFRKYVGLILKNTGSARYLSKNNNNILRIDGILKAFPEAQVLIPFRHPTTHARSLLAQHRHFLEDQDRFTRVYMGWLAHHEFGPGHRPFLTGARPPSTANPEDIAYWLDLWGDVYTYLLKTYGSHPNVRFICYEQMCRSSEAWTSLCDQLCLPEGSPSEFRLQEVSPEGPAPELLEALYRDMSQQAQS